MSSLFRVRVSHSDVPAYSYLAKASSSFQCWENALDRILENRANPDRVSVSVISLNRPHCSPAKPRSAV